jgi:hypothetical protein
MLIGEQFHSLLRRIQNQCKTDNQMDIISYFLSESYKVTDFLSVEKGKDDDTVKFYNSKVSKDKFLYTLFNPTVVELSHEIYTDALKQMLIAENIKPNEENNSRNVFFNGKFNQGNRNEATKYRIVAEYPAWQRYKPDYNIIHLISVDSPVEFSVLVAEHNKQTSALRPSLNDDCVKSTEIKFGRFLNKVLTELQKDNKYLKFTAQDIETFVNLYKANNAFDRNAFEYFKIVEGEEINKWYAEETYAKGCGTLNNSCMRLEKCQEYFDIYTNLENNVKMLILTNEDNKLIGRCLLWETDKGKYMDRVYANDHIQNLFKKWGTDNEYNLTHYNGSSNTQLTTKIKVDMNKQFPYLDSFRFMTFEQSDKGNLATLYTQQPNGRFFLLNETNGTFQLRN